MSDEREPAVLLREAMAAEARSVTAGPAFTERVLDAARQLPAALSAEDGPEFGEPGRYDRPSRSDAPDSYERPGRSGQPGWRGWLLPAAAAAVAAVLLAAVLIGTSLLRPDRQPPASQSPSPSLSSSPSPSTPGPSQSASPSPSPATSTSPSGQGAVGGLVPAGFWAADLTWVSTDEGWALGTAPCTQATCTVIAHTTDGGKTWARVAAPPAGLEPGAGCLSNCVKHLRFANSQVGYAYGSDRLFLTTDGGRTWSRQPGHADALEVGDGTVIRVTSKDPQCLPGCFYQVQRAAVGSSTWQDVSLPPGARTAGVEMVRSGPVAAIATYANTAGGAQDATSVLFVSADDGASWSARHDPCPSRNGGDADGEVDTKAITIGADRSISVLCTPRGGPAGGQHTMTSTDGGNHFVAAPATLSGIVTKLGAASAQVLFASTDHLYRSTDGGRHWEQVYGVSFVGFLTVPDQQLSYLGFQTTTVGRAVEMYAGDNPASLGSAMVWTTTDAGKTWKSYPFR